jgi:hypothetical protein
MPRARGRAALLLVALLALVFTLLPAHRAWAAKWVELRVVRDDARVELRTGGKARVEHRIELLVSGGPLESLVVRGVDRDAAIEPDAQVSRREDAQRGANASAQAVVVERIDLAATASDSDDAGGAATAARTDLQVRFVDGGGLRRGAYVLLLRYTTDLRARGLVTGEGPTRVVTWKGPTWDDGLDTTRVTFVVPPASTAPSVVDPGADGGEVDGAPTFLATSTRTQQSDEIALVKPYAPKGEAVTWAVRVDARALGEATRDGKRGSAVVTGKAPVVWGSAAFWDQLGEQAWSSRSAPWLAGSIVFVVWALLVAAKSREASRTHAAVRARARPLLPLPLLLRAPGSAAALVAGLWLQLIMPTPTRGALLLVVAALLAAHRSPTFKVAPRGPGNWLVVAPAEAFASPPRPRGAWLDASSRGGAIAFSLVVLAGIGAVALLASRGAVDRAIVVGLDLAVFFPIFLTGRIADLPPDPATAPATLLRNVARRIERLGGPEGVRVVPRIRVPKGGADPDDLRLAMTPTRPLPGFRGLAIGASFGQGAFGWVALPEILVRVQVGSPADRALGGVARRARVMEGAREGERVLSFVPRLPTASVTATLAVAVISRLVSPDDAPMPTPLPPRTKTRREDVTRDVPAVADKKPRIAA